MKPTRAHLLSVLFVIGITFTLAACKKQQAAVPADEQATGGKDKQGAKAKAKEPASDKALAKAPTTPPSTILDVPKPGEASKTVQNSVGGGGRDDGINYYRHVRRKLPLVNACYARQRRRNPGLRGKLTVQMTVRPKGDVKDAKVVSRSLNSPPLEGCVVATVKSFHFQPSGAKAPMTLTLPLLFR